MEPWQETFKLFDKAEEKNGNVWIYVRLIRPNRETRRPEVFIDPKLESYSYIERRHLRRGQIVGEILKNHNTKEYLTASEQLKFVRDELQDLPDSPKVQNQGALFQEVIASLRVWFEENGLNCPEENQARVSASAREFKHSPDYSQVALGKQTFKLTPNQAKIIKVLHEAPQNDLPSVGMEYIRREAGVPAQRLSDVFKSRPEAWKALIHYDKHTRTYTLNM